MRTATTKGSDVPQVTVTGEGPVAYRLSVSGATPGKPFWLVLGQSLSPGWQAKADGIGSLGKPQLVDGYANGWLITPKSSDFDVSLDWTPQKRVWIGIGHLGRRAADLPADGAAPRTGAAAPVAARRAAPRLRSRAGARLPVRQGPGTPHRSDEA